MLSKPINILIYGTGAVGSTMGWRMAQTARCRLSAVCRSNYDAVKAHGVTLKTEMWGGGTLQPYRVVRSVQELQGSRFDYIISGNKLTQGTDFARAIEGVIDDQTTLVTTQNGLDPAKSLISHYPNNRILGSICYVACKQPKSGFVEQTSNIRPHAFAFGLIQSAKRASEDALGDEAALRTLVALDESFQVTENLNSEVWAKLAWNSVWNPICALTGLDTHDVLATASASLRETMDAIAKEVYHIALACGIQLPATTPKDVITASEKMPSLAPSMLQDVRRGRPLEIETLCGNIWRRGARVGVEAPTVRAVYGLLQQLNNSLEGASNTNQVLSKRPAVKDFYMDSIINAPSSTSIALTA